MLRMLRNASTITLKIENGTSRDLPQPKPTRLLSSPTTFSDEKPKIRLPFTTLATRSTATNFSWSPSPLSAAFSKRTITNFLRTEAHVRAPRQRELYRDHDSGSRNDRRRPR